MARKPLIITAILLATFGIAAVPVMAEDAAPGHADTHSSQDAGDAHGGHKETALLHWDFGAALWSIAVFVVLLIILRVAAWKPILKGLNERENFIRNSLEEAKRERELAQQQQAEFEAKLQKSQQEAAAVVEEGRRDAEEMRKRIVSEAKHEAEAVADRAKREIELARNDALQKLHDQTVALSTMVAGKMIRRDLTAGDHDALINESIAELSRMNN